MDVVAIGPCRSGCCVPTAVIGSKKAPMPRNQLASPGERSRCLWCGVRTLYPVDLMQVNRRGTLSPTLNRGHVLTPASFRRDAGCSPDVSRPSRVRRRLRVAQAIIAALIMMPSAGRGDSQQSMNQSGMAKDGAHVTFAPPFPAPPDVNMFVPDIEK